MTAAECAICISPIKSDIEKYDSLNKADDVIKWARKKGIRLNRATLAKHRKNHLDCFDYTKENTKNKKDSAKDRKAKAEPKNNPKIKRIDDLHFLDTIRDMVYENLINDKIDLKIDSAFKAIELKNKLNDVNQNEKLLLEILSEIRTDELSKEQLAR